MPSHDGHLCLCLSGGGYRAAIFHLGALRWLNECGALSRLKSVSCVSGGSIIGAHLALSFREGWPLQPLSRYEWESQIVEPFSRVVQRDVRTWPVLVRVLNPLNWPRPDATVEALRRLYIRTLCGGEDVALKDLPPHPEFVFCATDMVFGVNWAASQARVGDYEAGYSQPPDGVWTVARAVACSSCFPPVFPPARTHLRPDQLSRGSYREADRDSVVRQIRLTDGGVYDNLGIEPVSHVKRLLVSDGGGAMRFALVPTPWNRVLRYAELLQNGIGKLRKMRLVMDFVSDTKAGAYWEINHGSDDGPPFANAAHAERLGAIRTDLNGFTRAEFELLQNHGYLCAANRMIEHCPDLIDGAFSLDTVSPPYPERWVDSPGFVQWLRVSGSRIWPLWVRRLVSGA